MEISNEAKSVIDLGAGSGAISIAITSEAALKGLSVSVIAVEKSEPAVVWLNKNITKYGAISGTCHNTCLYSLLNKCE